MIPPSSVAMGTAGSSPNGGGELPAGGGFQSHPGDGGTAVVPPTEPPARPPGHHLRDTPENEIVVFDPNAVYAVGYVSGFDNYTGPYGIAPLEDTSDAVLGIPLFADLLIRPTDGHLLYSYLGADANGMGVITPLYEFRREEAHLDDLQQGETVVRDGYASCQLAPRGALGGPNTSLHYAVAFDGIVFHSCAQDQATSSFNELWLSGDGARQHSEYGYVQGIGAGNRALAGNDQNTYTVYDFATGQVFATHTAHDLFGSGAEWALATRVHAGGFWLAGGGTNSTPTAHMTYASLDPSGAIVTRGEYAPLPPGITLDVNNWVTHYPVLDGYGSLYQFAWDGDDAVIVRRPMNGRSAVVYRQSSYSYDHAHQVMPDSLVTGP